MFGWFREAMARASRSNRSVNCWAETLMATSRFNADRAPSTLRPSRLCRAVEDLIVTEFLADGKWLILDAWFRREKAGPTLPSRMLQSRALRKHRLGSRTQFGVGLFEPQAALRGSTGPSPRRTIPPIASSVRESCSSAYFTLVLSWAQSRSVLGTHLCGKNTRVSFYIA